MLAYIPCVNRSKDLFSTEPVPKSFYFPSPQKYVDGMLAIQTSQRASETNAFKGMRELSKNNNACSSSSMTTLKNLPFVSKDETSHRKDDTPQFDEVWPESERPSSPSFIADTSAHTAATEFTLSEESNLDVQEAANRLEFYDRHRSQNETTLTHAEDDAHFEESTLQKYINRFRESEPKSREERMKEKEMQKQEFWWLQSGAKQKRDTSNSNSDKMEREMNFGINKNLKNDSKQGIKLTKEALLAMDEATLHLQTKADLLLSKSEISLVSSGPIVSTDGLGTSCSLSDHGSSDVDTPSYRPTFINARVVNREERHRQLASPAKPNCGDILARWRFRRKMEESHSHNQPSRDIEPSHSKPSKSSEMDARLEEFRKRLMSHRMLVTPVDIQFERQKMALLLEKDEETVPEPLPPKVPLDMPSLQVDPVLERLQRKTKSQDLSHHISSTANITNLPQNSMQPHVRSDNSLPHCAPNAYNANNSSIQSETCGDPTLNKNIKASSNLDGNGSSVSNIDNFGVQIVGDAKSKVFDLGQSQATTGSTSPPTPLDKHNTMENHNESSNQSHTICSGAEKIKTKRPLRDLPPNQLISNTVVVAKEKNQKDVKISKENLSAKQMRGIENEHQVYHKFLQAEKPNSEMGPKEAGHVKHSEHRKSNKDNFQRHSSEINDEVLTDVDSKGTSKKEKMVSSVKQKELTAQRSKANFTNKSLSKMCHDQENMCSSDSDTIPEQLRPNASVSSASTKSSKHGQHISHNKESDISCINTVKVDDGGDVRKNRKLPRSHPVKSSGDPKIGMGSLTKAKTKEKSGHPKDGHSVENSDQEVTPPHVPGPNVQSAIGQTVRDHVFDGSLLLSSVDSWASAFPPSPVPAQRSLPVEASSKTPSPLGKLGNGSPSLQSTPLQSMPLEEKLDISDEDVQSNEEFEDDPLLKLLRQQREQYIQKLELIELRLQEMNSSDPGS
ncbi:hypothetical protein EGW08_012418 [Elysia chlorotica]|uniref:Uncharacterized protein n=1 Tax=Elysia chlorotica TaxID=188477 RepID=A0A433TE08_ELYCH|nr:hypothetical protein EGW08_012418 [Elysia chlorotica]